VADGIAYRHAPGATSGDQDVERARAENQIARRAELTKAAHPGSRRQKVPVAPARIRVSLAGRLPLSRCPTHDDPVRPDRVAQARLVLDLRKGPAEDVPAGVRHGFGAIEQLREPTVGDLVD